MNDDQLESLLRAADESAGPLPEPPPDLADHIRRMYEHRQARSVRVKFAVALAGCYAAGMLTMWGVSTFASARQIDVADARGSISESPGRSTDAPSPTDRERDDPKPDVNHREIKRHEMVAEKSGYQLLRQLGDESQRRNDFQAAVAYYSQALDAATDDEQKISYEQDNWLLISLKKDRIPTQKEPMQGDST